MTNFDDWSAATFAGARRARILSIARTTTPAQRMEWLGSALELALKSGAIERERARRQAALIEVWGRPDS